MKKSKIIVPALGIIAFATAASITGTVAWFTAQSQVTISGMQFRTAVSDNLFIAAAKTESAFTDSITQEVKGILLPTSTVNGVNYFYTTEAKADGSAKNETFTAYTGAAATGTDAASYADKFSQDYKVSTSDANTLLSGETGAKPYLTYFFYLKANFTTTTATYLVMDKCELKYNGAAMDNDDDLSWRVAVLSAAADSDADDTAASTYAPAAGDKKVILSRDGAAYHNGKAVSAVNTLSDITINNWDESSHIYKSEAAGTKYFKVAVRLWLEGQDTKCTVDTYKSITSLYTLDLSFKLTTTNTSGYADKINNVKAAA